MIVESDFKFDYSKVDVLPDRFVDNLNIIAVRKKRIERVKELQKQISNLKQDLAAETFYIASEVVRTNTFPRFSGLGDFVSGGCHAVYDATLHDDANQYKTFFSLAMAVQRSGFEDTPKVHETFQMRLNDFIWLFFQGGGTITTDEVFSVDYCKYAATTASSYEDFWPAQVHYYFNALNLKNGKAYSVCFSFSDVDDAIRRQHARENGVSFKCSKDADAIPYETVRRSAFGAVGCYVSEIMKQRHRSETRGDQSCGPSHYLASFDPIEIAAFVKKTVLEGIKEKENEY